MVVWVEMRFYVSHGCVGGYVYIPRREGERERESMQRLKEERLVGESSMGVRVV